MKTIISRIAKSRRSWPGSVNRAIDSLLRMLPDSVTGRIGLPSRRFTANEVPVPPVVPEKDVRLYIAPVNFAGQAYEWARAAERIDGVGAICMQYSLTHGFGFPVDNLVPAVVYNNSRRWQREQFSTVSNGFTHVIFEAERPIFGTLFNEDVDREVAALRSHGVAVGMLSHGSDLRIPSRHREIDEWSPFRDRSWPAAAALQEQSLRHHDLLARLGAPVFVSTPDLLLDWPEAVWLPLALQPQQWRGAPEPLERLKPRVVHTPSNGLIKGSALIEPVIDNLVSEGLIDYVRVEGVPSAEIPALYKQADIVLEQFRIGTYSRAAVEGMAAGRIVVAHVHDQVRDHVRNATGLELPVVQATPDTLDSTMRDILSRRQHFQELAIAGANFATIVHDGRASADALRSFLGR